MTISRRERLADYWSLTKPDVNLLIGITTAAGFLLGRPPQDDGVPLLRLAHAVVGTLLVAAGTGTLNQWMEWRFDALMRRTAKRPVAAGRIAPASALSFGALLCAGGIIDLATQVNALAAGIALLTMASYLLVYTPLKRKTPLCTAVGAIPGAAPPLIGWAAATGSLSLEAWLLFAVLFLWQFPHFMAIAWLYRADYERAGYFVLPRGRAQARFVTLQTILPLIGLILGTVPFGTTALFLGLAFLCFGLRFVLRMSAAAARRLLLASIVYLPALLALGIVFRFHRNPTAGALPSADSPFSYKVCLCAERSHAGMDRRTSCPKTQNPEAPLRHAVSCSSGAPPRSPARGFPHPSRARLRRPRKPVKETP